VIRFLIQRVLWSVWLFFVVTLTVYVIFFLIPGSPLKITTQGLGADAQLAARLTSQLHLDVSIYQQYWIFVWNIIRHQSLGYSYHTGVSVRWIIGQDSRVTGSLVFGGLLLWLLISVPLGILSALKPRSLVDRAGTVFVLAGISAPPVWLGLMLAYVFGFKLGWTPIADYCNFFPDGSGACGGPARWAYHLLLPWVTFAFLFAAIYLRMIRSTLTETLHEDFVRTAWAKGAPTRRVLIHHVFRNSLLPVVTMLGMDVGVALGGAVLIENVFSLHGLGQELVTATHAYDVPIVVGIITFVAVAVIVCNFVIDVTYAYLDPRIRLRGS
jgi:peptide/nickel transport system permease protein